jgi:hypothetical protein
MASDPTASGQEGLGGASGRQRSGRARLLWIIAGWGPRVRTTMTKCADAQRDRGTLPAQPSVRTEKTLSQTAATGPRR